MAEEVLITPIRDKDLVDIKAGDIIHLNGYIVTCRDVAHCRLIEDGRESPINVAGGAILHAGPIARPVKGLEGRFEVASVGPTTSMYMKKFEKEFIARTGVKLIAGKGGTERGTEEGCAEYKALHYVLLAGCMAVVVVCVGEIEDMQWCDLGMPETLWVCRVKEFGPLIVSIDTHGSNLFEQNRVIFNQRKDIVANKICEHVSFVKQPRLNIQRSNGSGN